MKFKKLDQDPRKIIETVQVKPIIESTSLKNFTESEKSDGAILLPKIEAIHAGSTRNYTRYPAEKLRGNPELKSGVYSWTDPYPKPVIYNHDVDTEATGRIQSATFSEVTTAGRPGIIVTPRITDKDAIQKIIDGRLLTVSIGATTDSAVCSVCGTDIVNEGFCGHWRGEKYDGITAEWIMGNIWFDELSWVNVPADQDAMVIRSGEEIQQTESIALSGEDYINLSQSESNWSKVTTTEASNENKKGEKSMTKEELQQALDEAKEEVAETKAKLEEKEQEIKTVKEEKTALEEKLTEATELADQVKTLQEEKEALETKLSEETAEKASLEEKLQEKEEEIQVATAAAEAATKEAYDMLVDRVAESRVILGEATEKEQEVEKLAKRSKESLNDTLEDLKEKLAAGIPTLTRQVETVTHPTGEVTLTEGKEDYSEEDILHTLFSGPAFK